VSPDCFHVVVGSSLPPRLVLRTARASDRDQIAELLTARGEAADAVDHGLVVDDPDAGWECCAVVVDGGTVVATATLLDETLHLDGVPIPAGQVELVATARDYEGRGLARALMGWAHERSAHRGHLVQVMIGIPYFYRRFGYQYAVPMPQARPLRTVPPTPEEYLVRPAGADDIPAMAALQTTAQRSYDLSMPHSPACWRWLVARDGSRQLVVERAGSPAGPGSVVATGRITPLEDGGPVLGEIAAADPPAARALLAHAATLAGAGGLRVLERPGSPAGDEVESFLAARSRQAAAYYLRVPDPVPLMDHLRPVLSARLGAATHLDGRDTGEAVVSFFREHVRLVYADRRVARVRRGGRMQAPGSVGGAGVAPDLIAPLLFGPHGIMGLAERHPDVYPGPDEAVMSALFPAVRADLLTFYLP
jgi:predicted N-acetyltransferase YhbS